MRARFDLKSGGLVCNKRKMSAGRRSSAEGDELVEIDSDCIMQSQAADKCSNFSLYNGLINKQWEVLPR